MIQFFLFLYKCARVYRRMENPPPNCRRVSYFAITSHDVPTVTVIIARGRDAWVVSTFALEEGFTSGFRWTDPGL